MSFLSFTIYGFLQQMLAIVYKMKSASLDDDVAESKSRYDDV